MKHTHRTARLRRRDAQGNRYLCLDCQRAFKRPTGTRIVIVPESHIALVSSAVERIRYKKGTLAERQRRMKQRQAVPYTPPPVSQEFLTPKQVADILQISVKSVQRKFADCEGVLDLGHNENSPDLRPYRILRIPRSLVYEQFRQ
jgi:hypothetical protein